MQRYFLFLHVIYFDSALYLIAANHLPSVQAQKTIHACLSVERGAVCGVAYVDSAPQCRVIAHRENVHVLRRNVESGRNQHTQSIVLAASSCRYADAWWRTTDKILRGDICTRRSHAVIYVIFLTREILVNDSDNYNINEQR